MDLQGAVVVITGASRGIGAAVARDVAARGSLVGLIARSAEDLEGVLGDIGARGVVATADVSDRQATIDAIGRVEDALGPVDVLVANAGIGAYGPLVDMSYEELERVVRVNVLGTIYAIRAVLPGMVERRRGHLVTIGSIAGRIGSPFEAVYSATKFAGVGLTEALAVEVAPYGIGVSLVNPGVVETEFGNARGHPYDRERPRPISAEVVAAAVVEAVRRDVAEAYVPRSFRGAVVARHLFPPLFRWGTARSFRSELRADAAKRPSRPRRPQRSGASADCARRAEPRSHR
ncbi:MAG: SDR family NAD(P)-dependent oxidoreductase [Actinobacteria bacterium]|nr:SDR family NAD(P)-dependent oxidoreductase [Actinomycetota bacterium]